MLYVMYVVTFTHQLVSYLHVSNSVTTGQANHYKEILHKEIIIIAYLANTCPDFDKIAINLKNMQFLILYLQLSFVSSRNILILVR